MERQITQNCSSAYCPEPHKLWIDLFFNMETILTYVYTQRLGLSNSATIHLFYFYDMENLFAQHNYLRSAWQDWITEHLPEGLGIGNLLRKTKPNPDWSKEELNSLRKLQRNTDREIQAIEERIREGDPELVRLNQLLESDDLDDKEFEEVAERSHQIYLKLLAKDEHYEKLKKLHQDTTRRAIKYGRSKQIPKTPQDVKDDASRIETLNNTAKRIILGYLGRFVTGKLMGYFLEQIRASEQDPMITLGLQESVLTVAQREKTSGTLYADNFGKASGYVPYTDTPITEAMLTPHQRRELRRINQTEGKEAYREKQTHLLTRYEIDWWKSGNHLEPESKLRRDLQYLENAYGISFKSRED